MGLTEWVCTCACKWGHYAGATYDKIFYDKNVAILGAGSRGIGSFRQITSEYLVALKKGHALLAVAKAKGSPQKTTWAQFAQIDDAQRYGFDLSDEVYYVSIDKWVELNNVTYATQGACNWINPYHPASLACRKKFGEVNEQIIKEQQMQNYLKQLEQSKNIILTGAPGTGKTYLAKKIAEALSGSYDQILLARIHNFDEETKIKIKAAKELLIEFQKKFPKNILKNMSLEQYCIGTGDNSSFSYWLERKLSPLGRFRPGISSRGHFVYWDKVTETYVVDESRAKGRTAEELMPQIAQSIQQLVDTRNPEYLPIPNLYQNQMLKILHSYFPQQYFPVFGQQQLANICAALKLPVSKNIIDTNKAIFNYFNEHKDFKYTDQIDIMYAIYKGSPGEDLQERDTAKEDEEILQPIQFVQFHPSYDYTDFVEGLRPVQKPDSQDIVFQLKSGIFKKLCTDAAANPNIKFILIIDEINRGEISKIFGELFFAIDPGYRGDSGRVELQYANLYTDEETSFSEGFYVPKNVYIIGTMNNIDRSVEPFDFAMRRRFQWIEIEPEDRLSMLDGILDPSVKGKAINAMTLLNEAIVSPGVGLNADYRIGPAYFLHLAKDKLNGNFDELWKYHIHPLLKEYLKGDPEEISKLEQLKNAYYGTPNANTQG